MVYIFKHNVISTFIKNKNRFKKIESQEGFEPKTLHVSVH